MISDNYVTGDNIYLRELQNFFFEVLGMMSVTHYGAIGDGRTDCYGPLQVAIDDAKRRKLDFIYVPMGRYIYTGELINMDGITFIGNPHAKIVNIRTCEEIPIKQFGWCDCDLSNLDEIAQGIYTSLINEGQYVDLSGVNVGDTLTPTPIPGTNKAYYIARVLPGEGFDIVGDFTFVTLNPDNNEVVLKYSDVISDYADRIMYTCKDYEKIFVISFQNTDQYKPGLYRINNYVKIPGDTMTGSLAIGNTSLASGVLSYAQGRDNIASGEYSFATGDKCEATGYDTSAQGYSSKAIGNCSHAEGFGSVAQGREQHVQGMCNIPQGSADGRVSTDYAHILGNGIDLNTLSNAHTVTWGGEAWFAGDVYVGSTSGTNKDAGSKKLATEEYVDNLIAQIQSLNYFQQSIAPTTWGTQVTLNQEYTETDNYGTWRIYADNSAGSGWGVQNAFDGDDSTGWKCDDTSQGNSVNIGMDFPVLIKPTEFRVLPGSITSSPNLWTATIQGKNTDNTWDTLISFELPETQNPSPLRPQVAVDKWYKGFRTVLTRPDGVSSTKSVIDSLEIIKGFWKEMT